MAAVTTCIIAAEGSAGWYLVGDRVFEYPKLAKCLELAHLVVSELHTLARLTLEIIVLAHVAPMLHPRFLTLVMSRCSAWHY